MLGSHQGGELVTYVPQEELQLVAKAAEQFRWQRDAIAQDLEAALNICRDYQRILEMLNSNDPNWSKVNQLLTKYKMGHAHTSHAGKIYVDGVDITDHPDSIEGSVTEVVELPASETQELPRATEDKTEAHGYIIEDDDGETD